MGVLVCEGEIMNEQIMRLGTENPIVGSFIRAWLQGSVSYIEMLELIAISLAHQNEEQRQRMTELLERSGPP